MPTLGQVVKSKTIDTNVLLPLVMWGLNHYGFDIPPEAAVGIMALANIALRLITKIPIGQK